LAVPSSVSCVLCSASSSVFGTQLDSEDQAEAKGKPNSGVDSEPDREDDGREKSEADGEEHGRAEGDPFGEAQAKAEGRCEGKLEGDSNPGHEGEPVREHEAWQKRAPESHSDCGRKAEAENLDNSPHDDAHTGYRALTRTDPHFLKISSRIPGLRPKRPVRNLSARTWAPSRRTSHRTPQLWPKGASSSHLGLEPSDGTCARSAERRSHFPCFLPGFGDSVRI